MECKIDAARGNSCSRGGIYWRATSDGHLLKYPLWVTHTSQSAVAVAVMSFVLKLCEIRKVWLEMRIVIIHCIIVCYTSLCLSIANENLGRILFNHSHCSDQGFPWNYPIRNFYFKSANWQHSWSDFIRKYPRYHCASWTLRIVMKWLGQCDACDWKCADQSLHVVGREIAGMWCYATAIS